MARRPDLGGRLISAAMTLAAEKGWRNTTLGDIADAAGTPPDQLFGVFSSKLALLNELARRIDAQVLAGGCPDGDGVRDNLFELLMRRFDAMAPYKDGVRAVLRDTAGVDPVASLAGFCTLHRSMTWTLELCGINASGVCGRIRTRVLGAGFLSVMRVWLSDDSEDLSKTMAALDRMLERLDRAAQRLPRRRRRPTEDAAPA